MGSDPAGERVISFDTSDLLGFTAALIDVASVSRNEAHLADVMEHRFRQLAMRPSFSLDRHDANVVVRTELGRPQRVVLVGHLDTVPVNENATANIVGERCFGLGAADMKGGLAVMTRLIEEIAVGELAPVHDVTFVFYEAEEIAEEWNGLRKLFATRPELVVGDAAIALEPTGGWMEAGCQGTIHLRATVIGERAHTARPWMGRNAVHEMGRLVAAIEAFGTPIVEIDGLPFREALQVVEISGGIARNVVPDRCEIVVNRRFAPRQDVAAAIDSTVSFLRDAGADDVQLVGASGAAPPNLQHPLIQQFVTRGGLDVRPKLGWTDVARFSAHGIAACNFGPGDPEIAHTRDEYVTRGALDHCYRTLRMFLAGRS